MMPRMREVLVRCPDETCKHNEYGYCNSKVIEMETENNSHYQTVVVCKTYEDGRDSDAD